MFKRCYFIFKVPRAVQTDLEHVPARVFFNSVGFPDLAFQTINVRTNDFTFVDSIGVIWWLQSHGECSRRPLEISTILEIIKIKTFRFAGRWTF